MGDKSKIEWTDATWNPATGCTKVSAGCENCYAERMAHRFEKLHAPDPCQHWDNPPYFSDVVLHKARLNQPLHWRKPRRVFVCSMGDLFHKAVPDDFILEVMHRIAACPQHTFMILTKRPERRRDLYMHYCVRVMRNCWEGVSVEDQATADERIPSLLQTPAAVRFVSCEPLLGPVDLRPWLPFVMPPHDEIDEDPRVVGYPPESAFRDRDKLRWVICGGESGPGARPMHPDWARSLRDQCQRAGVPFFFKQWGEWVGGERLPSGWFWYQDRVTSPACGHEFGDGYVARRAGKKAAGRELDGRTWDEYPAQRRGGE